MSRTYSEMWPRASVVEFALNNPSVPRVIGIDVGQANLAVWFGAPDPHTRSDSAAGCRFLYMAWIIIHCAPSQTNVAAKAIVLSALAQYRDVPFSLASDVVIEKQHKKNGRMRYLAECIRKWIRECVPNGRAMRLAVRPALHKFANIQALPCPMPREYKDRKDASAHAVDAQTRQWAGMRWTQFLNANASCADDLSDAALIAQDYMIAQYLILLVATHRLADVSRHLTMRRQQNTWHKKKKKFAVDHVSAHVRDEYEDDDAYEEHAAKRRRGTIETSDLGSVSFMELISKKSGVSAT